MGRFVGVSVRLAGGVTLQELTCTDAPDSVFCMVQQMQLPRERARVGWLCWRVRELMVGCN